MSSLIAGLTPCAARAQSNPSLRDTAQAGQQTDVAPGSPRAALEQFLALTRAGQYEDAAAYLDLPDSLRAEHGAGMARRLEAILDRHQWVDLARISPLAERRTSPRF